MANPLPTPRRPSGAWGRLKPAHLDPLESMGLPSKGDNRLLDPKTQESYYNKIVSRYMQFCAKAGRSDDALDQAFASLSLSANASSKPEKKNGHGNQQERMIATEKDEANGRELTILLSAMRKLRESIVAASRVDTFAQRAYIFTIRSAILCSSYESYYPALLHLLFRIHLHTPLPTPELDEFVGYYILDTACRLGDLGRAYEIKIAWRFKNQVVEGILRALVHDDWVQFWKMKSRVDGYMRKLVECAEQGVRTHALKCLGRSYLSAERVYVERCTGRSWGLLKEIDGVGWELQDGSDRVVIRRIKVR
ncbi:MAG: hypothetical protein MMC33_000523 [Icmadophila ericetorum]|nr:hypothetical protein [Icmadophila ericetorum]